MRIHGQPRNAEGIPQNNVGCFASNSRKRHKFFQRLRNLSAKNFDDALRRSLNTAGLVFVKAGALNQSLKLRRDRTRVSLRVAVLFKKRRRDDIDPLVCTLGGKNRRDEQLERIIARVLAQMQNAP